MAWFASWVPLTSAVVSFAFTGAVLQRWVAKRRPYLLLWGIGLLFYGLGALSEALTGFYGWNDTVFRLWYLSGAILTAAWLGQGTVYLLARRRTADVLMVILALGSAYAAFRVFGAQLDPSRLAGVQLTGQAIVTPGVRTLTPFFNIYGTLTLVGGALYSAWLFWRKRVLYNRMVGNLLIALGALSPALGGTFTRFGVAEVLYVSELIGALLMFAGFLKATAAQEAQQPAAWVRAGGGA